MFVDDEQDITLVVKEGLEKHGFVVDAFNDPRQALEKFKPRYYDAIILDVRMPGLGGFELAQKIWAVDQNANICFMTAFQIYENEARKVFTNFKSFCFVKKPITPKGLAEHIESILSNHKISHITYISNSNYGNIVNKEDAVTMKYYEEVIRLMNEMVILLRENNTMLKQHNRTVESIDERVRKIGFNTSNL